MQSCVIILIAVFDIAAACSGNDCCACLSSGGGAGCSNQCTSCSSACQTCVKYGGGAGCISDGRCSCGAGPSPPPPPPPPGPGSYNPSAAVSYANANCNAGGGECAEFVSGALQAGGFKTCFTTWVPTLDSCLKSHGWRKGTFPGAAGSVVIWTDSEGPYHTALSLGNGNIDQHNPYRCGTSGSWGTNYVLNPPDYIEANSTVTV